MTDSSSYSLSFQILASPGLVVERIYIAQDLVALANFVVLEKREMSKSEPQKLQKMISTYVETEFGALRHREQGNASYQTWQGASDHEYPPAVDEDVSIEEADRGGHVSEDRVGEH